MYLMVRILSKENNTMCLCPAYQFARCYNIVTKGRGWTYVTGMRKKQGFSVGEAGRGDAEEYHLSRSCQLVTVGHVDDGC